MITVTNVSLNFSGQNLFSDVNLKFTPGNCYGVIGANGAGKSTFLKILSGELDSTTGEVSIDPNCRMSVLKQDHFAYDEYTVLDTIIMGNKRLYDIMKEKDALYEKEDFSDEDGIKAAELEAEFAEMDGWEADSNASKLMQGLGLDESIMSVSYTHLDVYKRQHKKLRSSYGEIPIDVPQDRDGDFEPQIVPKRKKDISAIEQKIIAMSAKGMTTRQISDIVEDIYGFEVSESMVTAVTNKILPQIEEWQQRPLSAVYPIVFIDAIHFSVRDEHIVKKIAAYIILGINDEGKKEVLSITIGENESAKYWLGVLNELKNRGVRDILISVSYTHLVPQQTDLKRQLLNRINIQQ